MDPFLEKYMITRWSKEELENKQNISNEIETVI